MTAAPSSPRVAVIGAGYWGKNLIRNFAQLRALNLICEANPELLHSRASQYPGVRASTQIEDALHDPDIDAVIIATPAAMHYAHAKEALQNGKHVFVEKPLSLHYAEGKELVDLAGKKGLILQVGHILEFHPAITTLKALVASGELGNIWYIYSHRLNLGKVRQEENILWSFAPHDISIILRLLGQEPQQVTAFGQGYLQSEIADVTVTTLSFANDVKAHIFVSWLHPYKEQKLVVIGDKKMAVFDDTVTEGKLKLYDKGIEWRSGFPVPRQTSETTLVLENQEPMKLECQHFLDCIRTGEQPLTDGLSALRVLKVLEGAQRSLERNGDPVDLAEIDQAATPEPRAISSPSYFVHPTSVVDEGAQIGEGTRIWHFSHIMPTARIGERCNLGQNVYVDNNTVIGNGVKIQNNVSVYNGVILEDYVFCGPSMVFTNVINPRSEIERKHEFKTTLVKRGATIGANATIVCGTTVGAYALIGAGAVVTKDVPDYALMTGVPARRVGWMCQCGVKLDFGESSEAVCKACGRTYHKTDSGVAPVNDPVA